LSLSSQKYGFGIRDPRSGIRKKPILDPGSRGQKGTGSRILDPDPQHCSKDDKLFFGSLNTSVVDRHCFDADLDPDPNFQYDADPDPNPDRHQNNADAHVDPTPSFLMLENQKFIYLKKV
jgi:hypothetical protein